MNTARGIWRLATHEFRWVPILGLSIVAILALVNQPPPPLPPDPFGIDQLYGSDPGGMRWEADWDGGEYAWSDDPWVEIVSGDNARYRNHDGVLTITGETSRLYVRDPDKERQWGNVEATIYAKRIDDGDVPYSGIVTEVRTNHGMTAGLEEAPCDTRAISARLRFDGTADFGKEISHPNTIATEAVPVFPDGMPYNQWIGYKHVVYDIDDGTGTHQELWIDLTGGQAGGAWKLVGVHEDHAGDGFGEREEPCADGIDPALPMTAGPRDGSESGLPNLSILFRADDINFNGLEYRAASVREIVAPSHPLSETNRDAMPQSQ
jgi:hypothetical protein